MEDDMAGDIRCKRIINGRTYNTETATLLGRHEYDELPFEDALFKTRHGAYFFYRLSQADATEEIKPFTPEAAQQWMEKYCSADRLEAEFGEMPEAGDPEARITLRIPETLRKRVAALADDRGQSLNAWILRCIERVANADAIS
jgi:predicted HicB family RNase H-like nuclease